ncbi:MAG: GNAT family N-acetyltransferase [Ruminococcus sp.]|nr:GNAT family N-acetyltransferase [Ruminococcus sp.]
MILRKAVIGDIPVLTELRVSYLAEDYGTLPKESEEMIRRQLPDYFRRSLDNGLLAYIAEDNGCAAGCCMLVVSEKPANPRFPHGLTGTVLNVYTKPEYRRQGIAAKLMEMLIADAKALGLDLIELKATPAGVKLYKSLGFEQDFSKYTGMKLVL